MNVLERHLIEVVLRCLCQTSQTNLLKMSSRRIFLSFQKRYLMLQCLKISKGITDNIVTTLLCFGRWFYDQVSTLQERVFWSRFPDDVLMMHQYHHNSLFLKICKFSGKIIYFVNVSAKCSLNLILSDSLNRNNSQFLAG